MAESGSGRFDGLQALFVNCTLKRSPRQSHTEGLMRVAMTLMERQGVGVAAVRAVDLELPPGVQPDMTEWGHDRDDWPDLYERVLAADILVLGTPIWLGDKSSVCSRVVERLYGNSGLTNDRGQYVYYGRVGGCIVTGNEDGVKHCAMNVLYSLQHLGFAIPPQADAGWIGEVGPGPSYLDPEAHARENDFTNRNVTFMSYNLMHFAALLRDAGGVPAEGNSTEAWRRGERFGHPFYDRDESG